MKLEKRLDLSSNGQPTAEPDNDLEWPDLAPAPPDPNVALAPAGGDIVAAPMELTQPVARASAAASPEAQPRSIAWIIWAASIASVLWLAMSMAALGYQWPINGPTVDFPPYQIAIFVVFAVAPVGLIWVAAFCVRQGTVLAAEAARTKALADQMLVPAVLAAADAGSLVEQVRREIEAAARAANTAKAELLDVNQGLADQTEKLAAVSKGSAKSARALGEQLAQERDSILGLTSSLDATAQSVADAIARQAKMVSEASDLAQTQIGEAEAALAARAADLAGAASDAGEAARLASEDLARQSARLETATIGVGDQIRSMEDTLTQQRAALVQVAHSVRADHEDLSINIETQHMQLTETLANTQSSVADLNEAAAAAAASLGELTTSASEQTRELAETLKAERDLLAASALQSLGALSEAAKFERETSQAAIERTLHSMSETAEQERAAMEAGVLHGLADLADAARMERDTLQAEALNAVEAISSAAQSARGLAESHANAARTQLEELGETAFAASQQAEAAFQARLADANELIARSAELVDQASARVSERIEQSATRSRAMLAELENALGDFEARMAGLPQQTQARAEELKSTLAASFDDLLASARAAAEETQAIDAAFQDRVRRNYEMLSEAVRLMGVVSGRQAGAAAAPRPAPVEVAQKPPPAPPPAEPPVPHTPAPTLPLRRTFPFGGASRASTAGTAVHSTSMLRPRLKLAPTKADVGVSQVFESASEPASADAGGWTWQELLSSMDDAPVDGRQLVDRLVGEIEALGVDADALFPPVRIEEIANVVEAGDVLGVRRLIRHLAPAAVRRLQRRALGEPALRAHAERFIKGYGRSLDEATRKGRPEITRLLSAEDGRAFLLFNAALGDPG
jgi:hypothetical protein